MTDRPDPARLLSDLADAAAALAQVIGRENSALARRDRSAAAALGDDKAAAARLFASRYAALREATGDFQALSTADRQFLAATLGPVRGLADDNAHHLAVAVEAGRRVMAAVAEAVRALAPGPGTYSARGRVASGHAGAAAGARNVAVSLNTAL